MIQMQTRLAVADNTGAKNCSASKCWAERTAEPRVWAISSSASVKSVIPGSDFKKRNGRRDEPVTRSLQEADPSFRRQLCPFSTGMRR